MGADGGVDVELQTFIISARGEVTGQLQVLIHLSAGEEISVPISRPRGHCGVSNHDSSVVQTSF
jgi:hypothetical protein